MELWQLKQLQMLPLEVKILKTQQRITEWYEHWNGQVYVSFSGGKDSTVLLHLVRGLYPEVPAVFVDTGLEYPEIKDFVKTFDNVVILRPKKSFREVINDYGYPVVSKEVSQYLYEIRTTKSENLRNRRLYGNEKGQFKLPKKWLSLVNAPFKISNKCCNVMKKAPIHSFENKTGLMPLIGTLADESSLRKTNYLKYGCNSFKSNKSQPLSFWTEQDILEYLHSKNLHIASVYGDIVFDEGVYKTTGVERTGCMFCMFGVHIEKGENRFQQMKRTHPKIYDYCVNNLKCGEVLDYIGVKY